MESESQTDYERPLKRAYLRQEIVEKGYSPEEFTDYCDNLKGADIDL